MFSTVLATPSSCKQSKCNCSLHGKSQSPIGRQLVTSCFSKPNRKKESTYLDAEAAILHRVRSCWPSCSPPRTVLVIFTVLLARHQKFCIGRRPCTLQQLLFPTSPASSGRRSFLPIGLCCPVASPATLLTAGVLAWFLAVIDLPLAVTNAISRFVFASTCYRGIGRASEHGVPREG